MVSKVSCCCISLQGCLFPSSSYIFVILAIWHKVQLTTLQIPFFAHNFEDNEATSCVRWLQIVWYSIHNPPTCPSQPVTVRLSISICETIATEHLLRTPPQKSLANHHLRHLPLQVATSYLQIIIVVPSQQPSPHSKRYCHIRDGHIEISSEKRCCLYRSLFKSTICN